MAFKSQKLTAADVHEVTTVKQGVIGSIVTTADGRRYRYAKNGATPLAAGATVVAGAQAAYTSTTSGAHKVAAAFVQTAGTVTAVNAPKYEDGILTIANRKYLTNGVAQNGRISLNDKLDQNVANGVATSLAINQFCGVVASATNPIGTAEVAVPADAYFWAFVTL